MRPIVFHEGEFKEEDGITYLPLFYGNVFVIFQTFTTDKMLVYVHLIRNIRKIKKLLQPYYCELNS